MRLDDVERVAVLGAGTMGHGIAEVAALAGYGVALRDVSAKLVREGYAEIEWSLDKLVESDHISPAAGEAALARIDPLVALPTAVGDADVVIEAVPERMEVKSDVYAAVGRHAPERALLATNTSSLSITDLATETDRAARFCGMHFFNPPVRMELVEVVAGDHTAESTLRAVESLAAALDKTPVRVRRDTPGFLVNRVLIPALNEACWMVHGEEATVAAVDAAAVERLELPSGVFELADRVGIDVLHDVLAYMHDRLGDAYAPCPLLASKVDRGDVGRKAGRGFYDYDDDGADYAAAPAEGRVARRLLAAMANEVARLLAEDVAPLTDVERGLRLGAGFPRGPAAMADDAGLDALVETLEARRADTGAERYAVAPVLRERARAGGFHADGA